MTGDEYDLAAINDPALADASGVPHAPALLALADAMVAGDDEVLADARRALQRAVGDEATVDAIAVASNFERMVRIADSTGIPVDPLLGVIAADLQQDLDLGRFGSASNTPRPSASARLLGAVARPVFHLGLRIAGRVRGSSRAG